MLDRLSPKSFIKNNIIKTENINKNQINKADNKININITIKENQYNKTNSKENNKISNKET